MPSFVPSCATATPREEGSSSSSLLESAVMILDAASEYLWSEELAASIDAFVRNHRSMFAGASAGGEQKLEWTQVSDQPVATSLSLAASR
eukprot:COSAG01_NODE_17995_length_1107_cov_1.798611_1_plen_89_part_01